MAPRELLCQLCGREYQPWSGPDRLWNVVAGGWSDDPLHFLCPTCFTNEAEQYLHPAPVWDLRMRHDEPKVNSEPCEFCGDGPCPHGCGGPT